MTYKHLNKDERILLHGLKAVGLDNQSIAKQLKRHPATISRELQRNSLEEYKNSSDDIKILFPRSRSNAVDYTPCECNGNKYVAGKANILAKSRRSAINKSRVKIKKGGKLELYILDKLSNHWSPEQISGRMRLTGLPVKEQIEIDCLDCKISHESIYKYIYTQDKETKENLLKELRNNKGKYQRRRGTNLRIKAREQETKKRIDTRPEIIELRARIGDWEGDTIVGGEKNSHILTHVDRKSGYLIANLLLSATAENTLKTTISSLRELKGDTEDKNKLYTITYDNGVQFSKFEALEQKLGIEVYFAYPYHSWERGTNENTNGLLRQYFPKKSLFANLTQKDIDLKVNIINNRPRKRLDYRTPAEVFYSS